MIANSRKSRHPERPRHRVRAGRPHHVVSSLISRKLTFGRVHGSAIAIVIGLALAYWGGTFRPAATRVWPTCRCSAASA